jgi:DNA-binding response OmpR family regulator
VHVIVADDGALERRLLEAAVRRSGHDVTAVADGQAAWDAFERLPAPLVILDWQMPGLNGLEVCQRIRASASGADTFVLMVTGRDAKGDLAGALEAGVDDYMMKPVTSEQLEARLSIAERRIQQSAARRQAETELAHARWLGGIGETTLALQHEVNNPLMALLAHLDMLSADPTLSEEQRTDVTAVREQARRIAEVIRRLAALDDPRSVEYLGSSRMIDLSGVTRPPKK